MKLLRLALAAALALLIVGCGGPSEADIRATVQAEAQATAQVAATQEAEAACGTKALNAYADTIEEQIRTFEQQSTLASSTPRASLGTPLQRLLDIQTETRKLKAPECLKSYHEQVVSMMGLYQLAYQNFAAQGDETTTQAALQLGAQDLAKVKQGLTTIRAGKVPPTPTAMPATPTA